MQESGLKSQARDGTLHTNDTIFKELGLKLILAENDRPPKYALDDVNELLSNDVGAGHARFEGFAGAAMQHLGCRWCKR